LHLFCSIIDKPSDRGGLQNVDVVKHHLSSHGIGQKRHQYLLKKRLSISSKKAIILEKRVIKNGSDSRGIKKRSLKKLSKGKKIPKEQLNAKSINNMKIMKKKKSNVNSIARN
jgi:hypothetical protein